MARCAAASGGNPASAHSRSIACSVARDHGPGLEAHGDQVAAADRQPRPLPAAERRGRGRIAVAEQEAVDRLVGADP